MQSSETSWMGSQCCGATGSFVPIPLLETHCQMPTAGPCCPLSSSSPIFWGENPTKGHGQLLQQPHTFAQGGTRVAFAHPGPTPEWCWGLPAAPCLQPMDEGSCRHYALRWYFHPMTNSCRPFIFGGCRGNGNRFESKWECEQHCKTSAGEAAPGSPILLFLRRKQENPSVIHPGASLASPATKDLGLSLKLEELPWSSPACEQSRTSLRVFHVSPRVQWAKLTPGRPVGLLLCDVGFGGLVFLVLPTLQAHGSVPQGKWAPAGPGSNANTTTAEQGMS